MIIHLYRKHFPIPLFGCTVCILLCCLSSCRGTKHLAEGEKLYGGHEFVFEGKDSKGHQDILRQDFQEFTKPEPNDKLLGSRPRVWFHNIAGTPKKDKGFRHWLKYKIGRKPVLLSDVPLYRTRQNLTQALKNRGFFQGRVTSKIKKEKKKVAKVRYFLKTGPRYRYNDIQWHKGDDKLSQHIRALSKQSVVEEGTFYDLEKLSEERVRLRKELRDIGYYYFDDEFLLFKADSTIGEQQVVLHSKIKQGTPREAYQKYRIGNVMATIESDAPTEEEVRDSLDNGTTTSTAKIDSLKTMNLIQSSEEAVQFKPKVITKAVQLTPGDYYNREDHDLSIDRLVGLNVFRYVNMAFTPSGDSTLDATIRLLPYPKKSLQVELQMVSKSNNFVGPQLQSTFLNRNTFKGAELFELSLSAAAETQINGQQQGLLNAFELGASAALYFPRFITPFTIDFKSNHFVPQTKVKLGFKLLRRLNFYELRSATLGFGYLWNETITKRHKLLPININYVQLNNTSESFRTLLENNPFLRQSFEEQFILGLQYSYYFNSKAKEKNKKKRHNFYFNGNVDISGNLAHLIQSQLNDKPGTTEEKFTLFGETYAQYVRGDVDFRYYHRLDRNNTIASRLILGAARAFGNSEVVPFIKQFSIGGSNSLRAFRARSVGPGGYAVPDSLAGNNALIDQGGEIKMEFNLEHRFTLLGALKGAIFTDIGNIWTFKEDPSRLNSAFLLENFLDDMAIGTGLGIRYDSDFFVVRFDMAFPLKVPGLPTSQRWVIDEVAIRDKKWRRDNLIFNIAIGYPF